MSCSCRKVSQLEPGYLDLAALAAYSCLSPRTLRKKLTEPGGPPIIRLPGPGKILVKKSDFDSWLAQFKQRPVDVDQLVNETLAAVGAGR